ncbi:hypothetical protein [Bordetella sp. N]|uniref:hypothetical protein n=1 Tax=Bordetella sp. N TaxID=1746199 RepID=UPI001E46F7D4|nr:hypothetical protein [Bordetella sp. N]
MAFPAPAHAQEAQDSPPLRVTAHAPSQAPANGTIELQLDVMTSTWFTQPPRLPTLTLPGVLVTPPSGEGSLLREQRDGVAYSGLRYTYLLIVPQAGELLIPALTVSAQVGPGGNLVSASSTPLTVTVGGAASVSPGGATPQRATKVTKLTITQTYSLAPDPLITGGRITRTITQRAEGEQAMLLPAAPLGDVPHFKRYALEPQVTTLTDGRGGFIGGQRIDRAEYVALEAGTFDLPALALPLSDAADGTPREQTLPGRHVVVAAAPKADVPFSLADDLSRLRQQARWVLPPWLLSAVAIPVFALVLLWLFRPWILRAARAVRAAIDRARLRWQSSEACYWRAWQREARTAPAGLSACYRWLRRSTGAPTMRKAVAPLDAAAHAAAEAALSHAYGRRSLDNAGPDGAGPDGAHPDGAGPEETVPHAAGPEDARATLALATRKWRAIWRRQRRCAGARSPHALPASLSTASSENTS